MDGCLVRPGTPWPGLRKRRSTSQTGRRLRGRRRDDDTKERHDKQIRSLHSSIRQYLRDHVAVVGPHAVEQRRPIHGLTMRIALSCLVDADHSDTAFFDPGRHLPAAPKPRWGERLEAFSADMSGLCQLEKALPSVLAIRVTE